MLKRLIHRAILTLSPQGAIITPRAHGIDIGGTAPPPTGGKVATHKVTDSNGAQIYNRYVSGVLKDKVGKIPYNTEVTVTADLGKVYQVEWSVGNYVSSSQLSPLTTTPPPVDVITPPDEFTARWKDANGNVAVTREYKRV